MILVFAVAAGIGVGFVGGLLFSRWDQAKMFSLVTQTSDSLVRSALFPGLSKEVFEPSDPEPAEEMYETAEDLKGPAWMASDEGPWDPTLEEADAR